MQQFIDKFSFLGRQMAETDFVPEDILEQARAENPWFTGAQIRHAIMSMAIDWLQTEKLEKWLAGYSDYFPTKQPHNIGLVMAGNIPLAGFQDLLCVLASGNKALIKTSSKDRVLTHFMIQAIERIWPEMNARIKIIEKLKSADAVIATGSNNSGRYFEQYFSKYPHIIRKNRNAVAVLSKDDNLKTIEAFGHDIFQYYGLGCRNVSKLMLPQGFDFDTFFIGLQSFSDIISHYKYKNNYEYNRTLLLLNKEKHYASDFLILKEDRVIASPVSVLNYEYYTDKEQLEKAFEGQAEQIQCIVSNMPLTMHYVKPGQAQRPALWDYADGVNTLDFLKSLN